MPAEDEGGNTNFSLLSSKHLPQDIHLPLVAFCDPHDLLAIATVDGDVCVLRIISGEVAFTIKHKEAETTVTALLWKADGSLIAVAWSDGTYGLYSGENGRLINQTASLIEERHDDFMLDLKPDFSNDGEHGARTDVTSFGWTIHRGAGSDRRRISSATTNDRLTTDDWNDGPDDDDEAIASKITPNGTASTLANLTRAIATLDVTKVLPKLSAIPAHQVPYAKVGPVGNKFASQAATDSILETHKDTASSEVQSLLVCHDNGLVRVLLDETVEIGVCSVEGEIVSHSSHPQISHHALLSKDGQSRCSISIINLPLPVLSGPLLHVIATNTKRIQNLVDYITYTVRCIEHDFTTGLQTPSRYLKNLSDTLSEKHEGSARYNLYHLAMTGTFSPTMLEWLVDIVKESNHKRWDQTVGSMYTKIQNHLFMNLLPAVDRLSIAITSLRGHATFHEGSSKFDVPPQLFTNMLEAVDCLRLVAQRMQLIVMSEIRQFRAFSKWLRLQIDIGVAEPFSKGAIEIEEREVPSLDYPLLLAYIKDTMGRSALERFIALPANMSETCSKDDFFRFPAVQQRTYDRTVAALKATDQLQPEQELQVPEVDDANAMLSLPAVAVSLVGHARVATARITEWQSHMLPLPVTVSLPTDPSATVTDMVSSAGSSIPESSITLVSVINAEQPREVVVLSVAHDSSQSSPPVVTTKRRALAPDVEILDAKFVPPPHRDSIPLLLLLRAPTGTHVATVHHTSAGSDEDETVWSRIVQYSFPAHGGFQPEKLLVGGRAGKRVCVVLGNRGREWRVLDLETDGLARSDGEGGSAGIDLGWRPSNS